MTEKIKRDFIRRCKASDAVRKKLKDHPDKPFAEFLARRLRELKEEEQEGKG